MSFRNQGGLNAPLASRSSGGGDSVTRDFKAFSTSQVNGVSECRAADSIRRRLHSR